MVQVVVLNSISVDIRESFTHSRVSLPRVIRSGNLPPILYRRFDDLCLEHRSRINIIVFLDFCARDRALFYRFLKHFQYLGIQRVTLGELECISHSGSRLKIQKLSTLVITNRTSFSSRRNKCMTTSKRLLRQESVISPESARPPPSFRKYYLSPIS